MKWMVIVCTCAAARLLLHREREMWYVRVETINVKSSLLLKQEDNQTFGTPNHFLIDIASAACFIHLF
jgi:hypothetical protein